MSTNHLKKMIVLLDNGHGGLINGAYTTPGKKKDWGDQGYYL